MAVEPNVDMRFVAPLIAAQLPRVGETMIKATIIEISPELGGEDRWNFLIAIKRKLLKRDYELDSGSWYFETVDKVASIHEKVQLMITKAIRKMRSLVQRQWHM